MSDLTLERVKAAVRKVAPKGMGDAAVTEIAEAALKASVQGRSAGVVYALAFYAGEWTDDPRGGMTPSAALVWDLGERARAALTAMGERE